MFAWVISRQLLKKTILFSLALCVTNLLVLRYLADESLETIDLGVLKGRTVVVDAGHGGIDSGARYHNLLEKDITLAISLKLGELLKQQGASVVYTRADDVDYYTKGKGGKRNDLMTRVDMINQSGADLFVSIHCNAVRDAQWYGSQVFYHPGLEQSKQLAETLQSSLKKFPPNNKRLAKADLQIFILKSAKIPGILLETGYLSNAKEAMLLSDQLYQENMVTQIAKALARHLKEIGSG